MRWSGDIHMDRIVPEPADVLRGLGVPDDREPSARTHETIAIALDELRAIAEPRGIFEAVSPYEFARIYEGQGDNAAPSPLASVFPRADGLTLFAVTLGARTSLRIAALFSAGDYSLGGILDAAASEATERAAEHITSKVLGKARHAGRAGTQTRALSYSPGYCGWNLTGQRALFAALEPGRIGITLTDTCLMKPVKSISGVVVVGSADIHDFDDDYDFCSECATHDCRDRIRRINEPDA
jgi:hypothetical protein